MRMKTSPLSRKVLKEGKSGVESAVVTSITFWNMGKSGVVTMGRGHPEKGSQNCNVKRRYQKTENKLTG